MASLSLPWQAVPSIELDFAGPSLASAYDGLNARHCEQGRQLLAAVIQMMPDGLELLVKFAHRNTGHRFAEEAELLGKRLGVDAAQVMLAAISYDLTMMAFGCSTYALAGPEGPVLVRNLDWWPEAELARNSYHIRHDRGCGALPSTHSASWPGFLGVVTGMTARGFALAVNAVKSPESPAPDGYPVLLFLRSVLEDASDFADALDRIEHTRLASDALITLVGCNNDERAVIERSPTRASVRRPVGDAPLVTTNDYLKLFEDNAPEGLTGASADLYASSCARYQRSMTLCPDKALGPEHDHNALLSWLTDPGVIQSITAQHVIACPTTDHFDVYVPTRLL